MMEIFLPDNFRNDDKIDGIFTKLAKAILKKLNKMDISYRSNEATVTLNTEKNIKDLLLDKDFYNCKFSIKADPFVLDIMKLPSKETINSILAYTETTENRIHEFKRNYDIDEYREHYAKLENLDASLTLSEEVKKKIAMEISPNFEQLKTAFSYKKLSDADRHYIITKMNMPVCPYCNMNYTISYNLANKKKTTADLDHFYLKSSHPQYALCLYNFIPSCQTCNLRLKGTKEMAVESHIYPHQEGFSEKSSFKIKNIVEASIEGKDAKLTIEHRENDDVRCKASDEVFQLKARYQAFNGHAAALLEKATIYSDSYRGELNSLLASMQESLDDKKQSPLNVKQLVFGNKKTEKELGRESLGKMTQDLLKQLGIFKKGC